MKPRNIAIALVFCMSLVCTSYAQSMPQARLQRLEAVAKELHLTHEQERQLLPILQAQEPKLQADAGRKEQPASGRGGAIVKTSSGAIEVNGADLRELLLSPRAEIKALG